jgi:hypothetical protein
MIKTNSDGVFFSRLCQRDSSSNRFLAGVVKMKRTWKCILYSVSFFVGLVSNVEHLNMSNTTRNEIICLAAANIPPPKTCRNCLPENGVFSVVFRCLSNVRENEFSIFICFSDCPRDRRLEKKEYENLWFNIFMQLWHKTWRTSDAASCGIEVLVL